MRYQLVGSNASLKRSSTYICDLSYFRRQQVLCTEFPSLISDALVTFALYSLDTTAVCSRNRDILAGAAKNLLGPQGHPTGRIPIFTGFTGLEESCPLFERSKRYNCFSS